MTQRIRLDEADEHHTASGPEERELEEALASIASGALRLRRMLQDSRTAKRLLPFLQALSALSPGDGSQN